MNMKTAENTHFALDPTVPIWDRIHMVAPLVVIGTKEGTTYDLAPKHMVSPLGFDNYFGFVCTPRHATYRNIVETDEFTVSFPMPDQLVLASLSASPRCNDSSASKPVVGQLPTEKASKIDALFLRDSYLMLECERFKIIDGFHENSLITGKVIAAYVDKNYIKDLKCDEQQQIKEHPLLAYIAYGRYAVISETYNFPFPKAFKR